MGAFLPEETRNRNKPYHTRPVKPVTSREFIMNLKILGAFAANKSPASAPVFSAKKSHSIE